MRYCLKVSDKIQENETENFMDKAAAEYVSKYGYSSVQ